MMTSHSKFFLSYLNPICLSFFYGKHIFNWLHLFNSLWPVGFHSLTMLFSHLKAERPRPLTIIEFKTCFHEFSKYEYTNFFTNVSLQLKKKTNFFQNIRTTVLCLQKCSNLLWEKNVLVIQKNFWNLRLRAKNLHNVWDH